MHSPPVQRNRPSEQVYKPGSVRTRLSAVVIYLGRASPHASSDQPEREAGHLISLLFDLAPGEVCQASRSPDFWCALTAPFHPYRLTCVSLGGVFSVTLSVGSPLLRVTKHPALWSPDFPQSPRRTPRPPGLLRRLICVVRSPLVRLTLVGEILLDDLSRQLVGLAVLFSHGFTQ
jgi:hypothetical protein